jgi:peptide-methionine (R)-S-oxide reductase
MNRRRWLLQIGALGVLAWRGARAADATDSAAAIRAGWQRFLPANHGLSFDLTPIKRPLKDWQAELPGDSYAVLFDEATEPPGSSGYNHEKRPGIFVCRACALPLFSSEMKYESGTGWPSFFSSIPGHMATRRDFKIFIPRTEYHCVRCGGHQGHVFDDGPAPTHERWCNNGVALRFLPRDA